jgi:hypothetical protein
LARWLNGRRPADILPTAGRMRTLIRISARVPWWTALRTRRAGGHRSLIADLGSSPLGELFHGCVSDGSCAYQVSVLSGAGIDRPMMVSEVPASECQLHRQQMSCQETANAAVEERCPSASAEPDPNPQRHAPRPVHRLVSGHARQRCSNRAPRCLDVAETVLQHGIQDGRSLGEQTSCRLLVSSQCQMNWAAFGVSGHRSSRDFFPSTDARSSSVVGCAMRSWTCDAGVRSITRLSNSGRL